MHVATSSSLDLGAGEGGKPHSMMQLAESGSILLPNRGTSNVTGVRGVGQRRVG